MTQYGIVFLFVGVLALPGAAWSQVGQVVLERPKDGETMAGITHYFGFSCQPGEITVSFNNGSPFQVTSGLDRQDTSSTCSNEGQNGFVGFTNFNLLSSGENTIEIFRDDELVASATFQNAPWADGTEFIPQTPETAQAAAALQRSFSASPASSTHRQMGQTWAPRLRYPPMAIIGERADPLPVVSRPQAGPIAPNTPAGDAYIVVQGPRASEVTWLQFNATSQGWTSQGTAIDNDPFFTEASLSTFIGGGRNIDVVFSDNQNNQVSVSYSFSASDIMPADDTFGPFVSGTNEGGGLALLGDRPGILGTASSYAYPPGWLSILDFRNGFCSFMVFDPSGSQGFLTVFPQDIFSGACFYTLDGADLFTQTAVSLP